MSFDVVFGRLVCHIGQIRKWYTLQDIVLEAPIEGRERPIWMSYLPILCARLTLAFLFDYGCCSVSQKEDIGVCFLFSSFCQTWSWRDAKLLSTIIILKNHSSSSSSSTSSCLNPSEGTYSLSVMGTMIAGLVVHQILVFFFPHSFSLSLGIRKG